MESIRLDDGLTRIEINDNGTLVFNPGDFNLYERFFGLLEELPKMEEKYKQQVEAPKSDNMTDVIGAALKKAREIDKDLKKKLNEVFGHGNDFDKLLGGVNLMSRGKNGERIIANLLDALLPYMEKGIKNLVGDQVVGAKLNREQRRALQKK